MPERAILLDALGTLVMLEPPVPRLVELLRDRHGLDVALADAARAVRAEMRHYRAHCVRAADPASLAQLRLECAAIIARELEAPTPPDELLGTLLDSLRFAPFPEVGAALARWRQRGLRLVVASNWDLSLHDVLLRTGLRPLLDGVVTSAEVGVAKPDARLFEVALEVAGIAAGEAVHVGDSPLEDVEGARAAGIAPVWLVRRGGETPPEGLRVIATLDELEPLP